VNECPIDVDQQRVLREVWIEQSQTIGGRLSGDDGSQDGNREDEGEQMLRLQNDQVKL
jgi:hypothetical protein